MRKRRVRDEPMPDEPTVAVSHYVPPPPYPKPREKQPMTDDPDWPGPSDAEAFVDSMFEHACEAVAGLPFDVAGQRFLDISKRFEAGLIERFNFTAEQAANAGDAFRDRAALEVYTEFLRQAESRGNA